jgi:hypothetical protein
MLIVVVVAQKFRLCGQPAYLLASKSNFGGY